ncbi:MAG TPA: GIY-YIG nuclease family protein [Lysobacter sp.]
MSRAKFHIWLQKAAEGMLPPDQVKELSKRFLFEAANDSGGERVYVPTNLSRGTNAMRIALSLDNAGFAFNDIKGLLGDEISERSFYRWKRERMDRSRLTHGLSLLGYERIGMDYVYAMEFRGMADSDTCVKVGTTCSPKQRLEHLDGSAGMKVYEMALFGSHGRYGTWLERRAHERMAEWRLEGEWFRAPGGLEEIINTIRVVAEENEPAIGRVTFLRI